MPDFCHLHCHTQFSLLDGASDIPAMMDKAVADGMKGIALTDHGNMFGAFKFVAEANKRSLTPVIGCEFYMVKDRHVQSFAKAAGQKDVRYHQLMLAKNPEGYKNLSKLCSLGFIEGMYSKFPRIDKELIEKYHKGLIVTSCCIGAIIPQKILFESVEAAEEELKWWLNLFGKDFYIELQRHGLKDIDGTGKSQEDVNQILLGFARKYDIQVIATNDSHYIEEEDWFPHDILLCVNTGSKITDPKGYGKGMRFAFPNSEFYFKTQAEMGQLFHDIPEALDNTMAILDKIEVPQLKRDILLPNFPVPPQFKDQADYLKFLVFEGAKVRYPEITSVLTERLDYELKVIRDMGFNGYFLIVQDFIKAAKEMGVAVGPGRGSGAGSAVAFCLGITNIDPLRYNLLFERFLNPERVSMPDFDIDFDDYGRQKVIDWVVDKYGKNQVAQIITFGTMAGRSSIRDVARVLDLPLPDADRIAKLVPTKQGKSPKLAQMFGKDSNKLKAKWQGEEWTQIESLQQIHDEDSLSGKTLQNAKNLEGSVRNTGLHAAGVIIAPDDITNYIPVCTSKDSDLLVTQFDGSIVEDAGMLKMDFLGLKTLSIIKDAIENIVKRHGEEARIDPDEIPLDDAKTFELFQRGETIGIFQFESDGMRKHMRELKPTDIEDLIAMNALYRPGPMQYIPTFVARKHGRMETKYPHEWLEEILKPTHGIMVYQEQIMQTAQIMADYSLGQADMLRRAMGKKKLKEMEKHRKIFTEGAKAKGVDEKQAIQIFEDMEKFASYGFNRSHAAAYSVLAFQTGYLKANYPAEFMASVLTHNKNDITKLNFFLQECKKQNVEVLGPDINESDLNFTVNPKGQIRFGLSALKGVGEGPVEEIAKERNERGHFKDIFDICKRLNLRTVNKKCLESLALGGAFDCFEGVHRAQYFAQSEKYDTLISHALKFGNAYQNQLASSQNSLFGATDEVMIQPPAIPECEEWSLLAKLNKEKDVTGIYISGHPLDDYALEVKSFATCSLDKIDKFKGRQVKLAALVGGADHRINKKGNGWGRFIIQDFHSSYEVSLFGEDYEKYKHFFQEGMALFITANYKHMKWRGEDEYDLKISKIEMLEEASQKMTESITVKIPLESIDDNFINNFENICQKFKGRHKLRIILLDYTNKISLKTVAHDQKVNADLEMVRELEKMGLEFKLN